MLPKAQARLKFGPQLLKLAREKLADAQIALEDARIRCSTHTVGCKCGFVMQPFVLKYKTVLIIVFML